MEIVVAVDDPRSGDVRALLERHLAFAHEVTPAAHVHALGVDALLDPAVTFFSARRDGVIVGVGALKELTPARGEIKSMHTAAEARGEGIGSLILEHLLAEAARRGYERVSLETGTGEAFVPAHALYRSAGFEPCPPFGEYRSNPYSTCMTLDIRRRFSSPTR